MDGSTVTGANGKRRINFLRLLIVLLVLFLSQPLVAGTGAIASSLLNLVFVVVLAVAAASVSARLWVRAVVIGVGAVAFVSSWVAVFWVQARIEILVYGSYLAFFTLVCANVLGHVFDRTAVDANKLYAVCCVYLLAGIAWAFLYAITEALVPGSFDLSKFADVPTGRMQHLIYFSLVTLTTLGYGDIAPVSGFAQTSAALEAIFGQAYLAVLVARLVGWRASATKKIKTRDRADANEAVTVQADDSNGYSAPR